MAGDVGTDTPLPRTPVGWLPHLWRTVLFPPDTLGADNPRSPTAFAPSALLTSAFAPSLRRAYISSATCTLSLPIASPASARRLRTGSGTFTNGIELCMNSIVRAVLCYPRGKWTMHTGGAHSYAGLRQELAPHL